MTEKLELKSKGAWCQKTPCACRPQSSFSPCAAALLYWMSQFRFMTICCLTGVVTHTHTHTKRKKTSENMWVLVLQCPPTITNPESTSGIGAVMFCVSFFFFRTENVPVFCRVLLGIYIENVRKDADLYIKKMRSRNKQCFFFLPSVSGAVSSPSLTLRIQGWHEADTGVWSREDPSQTYELRIGKNVNILIVLEEETCWETGRSVWKWPHFSMLACHRSTLRHTHTHSHTHTKAFNLLRAPPVRYFVSKHAFISLHLRFCISLTS